jgi:uncharacterized membrane protein YoaK (UPF0700 family)
LTMTKFDHRLRFLAACLSSVAGFVDAIGFISLGGFFVSFMSGNTTRIGVGLAGDLAAAGIAASLVALFVVGVICGAIIGRLAKSNRRPLVLAFVAALLIVATTVAHVGLTHLSSVGMVLAMGALNAVFVEEGEVRIGVTYMTGTLVKLGKSITSALLGGDRLGWVPFLLMWLGLLAGGLMGTIAYRQFGLDALGVASVAMAICAWAASRIN